MFRPILCFLLALCLLDAAAPARAEAIQGAPNVGFTLIPTASLAVREGLLFADGSLWKQGATVFSAVLVKHGDDTFLFDSGLGSAIDQQYQQDMPLWQRAFFKYEHPVTPARQQLDRAGFAPLKRIILSHSHWDHASGIADFPEAEVWAAPQEIELLRHPASGVGGVWPSQVGGRHSDWRVVAFKPDAFEGFGASLDLYGDGKVVLVPLFGHTPGSIGLFVTTDSGHRYFFCGDAVWSAAALKQASPKFWPARMLVDRDAGMTQVTVNQLRTLSERLPDLVVVPAHDAAVQGALGFFPRWVR
jgi:glyoxylase-like metal-dependent hydrolase (beta-lactamase superfamily II)